MIVALCVAAARGDEKTENDFSRRRANGKAGHVEFPQRRGREKEKKAAEGTSVDCRRRHCQS